MWNIETNKMFQIFLTVKYTRRSLFDGIHKRLMAFMVWRIFFFFAFPSRDTNIHISFTLRFATINQVTKSTLPARWESLQNEKKIFLLHIIPLCNLSHIRRVFLFLIQMFSFILNLIFEVQKSTIETTWEKIIYTYFHPFFLYRSLVIQY